MSSEERHSGATDSEVGGIAVEEGLVCRVCGKPVQTPLKCSVCRSVFHISCVTVSGGLLRRKKQYVCPVCGHRSESYQLRMGE